MFKHRTTGILFMSLTLTLASCANSTLPADPTVQSNNSSVSGEDTAQSMSDLTALAVTKPSKTYFDHSGGCESINNTSDNTLCLTSNVLNSTNIYVTMHLGPGNNVKVFYKNLDNFCIDHVYICRAHVATVLNSIQDHTAPPSTCASTRRRLLDDTRMNTIKWSVVGLTTAVIAGGTSLYGYEMKDFEPWMKATVTGGATALAWAYFELADGWLHSNTWTSTGASKTAFVIKAMASLLAGLPAAFHTTNLTGVQTIAASACPNNYAAAFEELPV